MKLLFASVALLLSVAASINADGCGGLLESDAGQLEFPVGGDSNGDASCLWIIKLVTGTGIRFTITRLDNSSVISLYPEHESTETVLQPIRLESTSVNSTVLATGKVLLVTLAQSGSSSGVSFTWESDAEETTQVIKAASYVDTPEGRVSWTKFGQQERLTWGLTLDTSVNLKVQVVTDFGRCDLIDPCMCTYFALYEVTPEGYLREATRVCGRPLNATIENLYPQLVAFVYVNVTGAEDQTASVELTWLSSSSEETTTTTTTTTTVTTTTTDTTTTETPAAQQLDCGGVLSIPTDVEQYYEYKAGERYDNNEFCIWVLNGTEYAWRELTITVESSGFEASYDGLDGFDIVNALPELRKCDFDTTCRLQGGSGLLVFSSDTSNEGTGFRIKIAAIGPQVAYSSAFFFDQTSGVFKYPVFGNYRNAEEVLAVFQLNQANFLQLTSLQTEATYDTVNFFTIPQFKSHANATFDGRWSGSYPSGVEASLSYAVSPRVVIFSSDGSNTDTGFEITWGGEGDEPPTTPEGPQTKTLECGGIIEFSSPAEFYIEYKANERYSNDEFCIWGFKADNRWGQITVTLESEGFETTYDGVEGYSINSTVSTYFVTFTKCRMGSIGDTCVLENGVGFLAFSSDGSNDGIGFRAHVVASTNTRTTADSVHFVNETQGVFKYPSDATYYPGSARALAIFQSEPDFTNTLRLNSLSTEEHFDFVHFFTIYSYRDASSPSQDGRWSGEFPDGVTDSLTSAQRPRAALFLSDGTTQYSGFSIEFERVTRRAHVLSQKSALPIPLIRSEVESYVQKSGLAAKGSKVRQ